MKSTLIYTWTKVEIILEIKRNQEIKKNQIIRAEMKIKYKRIKIQN